MTVKITFSKFIHEEGCVPCKEIFRNEVTVGYIEKKKSWNEPIYTVCATDWTEIARFETLKEANAFAKGCFQSQSALSVALTESFRQRINYILKETAFHL